jgi:hypothetical protein
MYMTRSRVELKEFARFRAPLEVALAECVDLETRSDDKVRDGA